MNTDRTLDFNNIELLYGSKCMSTDLSISQSFSSPDLQSDKSDLQLDIEGDDSELFSEIINGSYLSTDIMDGMIKSFDPYDQIKAPANCFLLYRSHVLKEITAKNPGQSSRAITSIIAEIGKMNLPRLKAISKRWQRKRKPNLKSDSRNIVKPKVRKRANSFRKTFQPNLPFLDEVVTPVNFDPPHHAPSSMLFGSFKGRKRSCSMPELPNALNLRSELALNHDYEIYSRLGPLLPITQLNNFKKARLSEAFGKLN